jgi:lipoprotein-releasing system permease protein
MIRVVFFSIALGSFALALVTAIMNGFESIVHERMQGIHAQLTIRSHQDQLDMDLLTPVLLQKYPTIAAISPIAQEHILCKIDGQDSVQVMMLMGIDPHTHQAVSTLHKKLTSIDGNTLSLSHALDHNQILIGKSLAQLNQSTPGDTIELYYSHNLSAGHRITLESVKTVIGGTYDTGIDDFDSNIIFCSLEYFNSLFPDTGISQLQVTLKPHVDEYAIKKDLQNHLHLEVISWKDVYKPLVAALTLEKYVMFFILTLITLVAGMNIISLLFMLTIQKRPDIAILTVIGCAPRTITSIFMAVGLFISALSCIAGLTAAWICSYLLEQYPFIQLPDVYYVSHLPAKMTLSILGIVFLIVMLISFFATLLPARIARSLSVAHILRFEG